VPGGRFRPGDLRSLPLDDGSDDAVVCALALVHVAEVRRAIAERTRVVRSGGRIVITEPVDRGRRRHADDQLIPDANRDAAVGLPAVLVAAFDRPAR